VIVVPQKIIGGSLFWRNLLTVAQISSSIAITAAVAGVHIGSLCEGQRCSCGVPDGCAEVRPGRSYSSGDGDAGCETSNMGSTYVQSKAGPIPRSRGWQGRLHQTAFAGYAPGCGWKCAARRGGPGEQIDHQNVVDSEEAVDEQMNSLIKDLAGEFAGELRQRDGECIARLRSTQSTRAAPPCRRPSH